MADPVEILIPPTLTKRGLAMLQALVDHISIKTSHRLRVTQAYEGSSHLLVLYGIGAPEMAAAADRHLAGQGRVIMWDQGYFGRKKEVGYLRCSIDYWHPLPGFIEYTPDKEDRWAHHQIALREDSNPRGDAMLIALAPKSRAFLGNLAEGWEQEALARLRTIIKTSSYPDRKIVYRPKPRRPYVDLGLRIDVTTPIDQLLKGKSLVYTRHSNVAVDAVVAGIPIYTDTGAAYWLQQLMDYSPENRLKFLRKLAYWQWAPHEAGEAWDFLMRMEAP